LCRLTGYDADSLVGSNVSVFSPDYGQAGEGKEAHERVLKGQSAQPYEQRFIKKDGTEAIIQIATSLTTRGGEPWAIQHVARDITQEKRAQENLRLYVQKISQAQEAERKRIARELHDDTAQSLVVVSRHLDDLASGNSKLSPKDIREEVRKILEGVRHFSQELRPSILDDLGLIPALKWLAADLTENHGINVKTEITGNQRQLPPEAELTLFRITQEALNNAEAC
jgi:PAS domain S-box-containing protein